MVEEQPAVWAGLGWAGGLTGSCHFQSQELNCKSWAAGGKELSEIVGGSCRELAGVRKLLKRQVSE